MFIQLRKKVAEQISPPPDLTRQQVRAAAAALRDR